MVLPSVINFMRASLELAILSLADGDNSTLEFSRATFRSFEILRLFPSILTRSSLESSLSDIESPDCPEFRTLSWWSHLRSFLPDGSELVAVVYDARRSLLAQLSESRPDGRADLDIVGITVDDLPSHL